MKFVRRLLSTSLLALVCAAVFSSSTALVAAAQQDESSQQQSQAPAYDSNQSSQTQASEPQSAQQAELSDQANSPPNDQPMEIPSEDRSTEDRSKKDHSRENDPPGRAARLQYMSGSVSIQPHGTDEWVQGSVNRPLTIADNVWADKNSRAELNVGTGLIRISSETSLTLTNVNDSSVQLSLHQGTMNLHVRHLYNGEVYEVDTPNQAFTIMKTGDYRFDVDPNADSTTITVWRGAGESTGQGPSVRVKAGEQVRFSKGNSLAHDIQRAPQRDGFDDWCQVRNRREDESISARYVSPDVIGSEDLDAYGTWRRTPEYGPVWVPSSVEPGWAPYAYGHWIYEDPWGWTWVDDAPWGFAPFHYGRWVSFGGYWGWAPGPYYGGWARGWYAPALVAWYGGGGWGVGFGGFGFGEGFGWCALGFGEPFIPWYHTGWGYFRNVNIYNTRITNINIYHNGFRNGFRNGFVNGGPLHRVNMNARGGFTAVNRGTLERGLPVQHNAVHPTSNDARSAPALSRVNASPTREARLGPNAGRPAAVAPSRAISSSVVSRMRPPAPLSSRMTMNAGVNAGARGTFNPGGNQVPGQRAPQGNMARPSAEASARPSSSQGHFVPRPPQSFARTNSDLTNYSRPNNSGSSNGSRPPNSSMPAVQSVPRPPSAGGPVNGGRNSGTVPANINRVPMSMNRSVPRPQDGSVPRAAQSPSFSSGGLRNNVPRPSGAVQPAPRNYSSAGSGSGYSSRPYAQSPGRYSSGNYNPPPRYNQSPQYGGPLNGGRSYGSSPYQGSHTSAPSYSGRSYGGGGSYGGGSGPAPSRGPSSYGSGGSRGGAGGGGSHGSSRSGGHR
jgi:ferric-dicitrate binding protein FerR (iron transport regulator)